ncbi:hypothetical protein P8452_02030 [Trifolium repens]|jgi:hypothetical protein|nr:hypothetical protein P8452_02030 [Trifolium repens]
MYLGLIVAEKQAESTTNCGEIQAQMKKLRFGAEGEFVCSGGGTTKPPTAPDSLDKGIGVGGGGGGEFAMDPA